MYLTAVVEVSLNACMVLDTLLYVINKEHPAFLIMAHGSKVSTGVEGSKTKQIRQQKHIPAVPIRHVQPFDVIN